MTSSADISQKLWNYCNVLRDAGLSHGDYLEQLTYLIFRKIMDELGLRQTCYWVNLYYNARCYAVKSLTVAIALTVETSNGS